MMHHTLSEAVREGADHPVEVTEERFGELYLLALRKGGGAVPGVHPWQTLHLYGYVVTCMRRCDVAGWVLREMVRFGYFTLRSFVIACARMPSDEVLPGMPPGVLGELWPSAALMAQVLGTAQQEPGVDPLGEMTVEEHLKQLDVAQAAAAAAPQTAQPPEAPQVLRTLLLTSGLSDRIPGRVLARVEQVRIGDRVEVRIPDCATQGLNEHLQMVAKSGVCLRDPDRKGETHVVLRFKAEEAMFLAAVGRDCQETFGLAWRAFDGPYTPPDKTPEQAPAPPVPVRQTLLLTDTVDGNEFVLGRVDRIPSGDQGKEVITRIWQGAAPAMREHLQGLVQEGVCLRDPNGEGAANVGLRFKAEDAEFLSMVGRSCQEKFHCDWRVVEGEWKP